MIKRKLSEIPKLMRDWVGAAHELSPTSKRLVEAWADFVEKESAELESKIAELQKSILDLSHPNIKVLLDYLHKSDKENQSIRTMYAVVCNEKEIIK